MSKLPIWWWLWAPNTVAALLFVAFGVIGSGPVHIDANYLTIPAVAWAAGQEFVNPLLRTATAFDPQGLGRFVYHGPGFQMVLRAVLSPATGPQALLIIHTMNALNILLFGALLHRLYRRYLAEFRPIVWIAAASATVSVSSVLLTAVGRPETLATMFLLFGAHLLIPNAAPRLNQSSWVLLLGVVLGLLGITHPLTGVEASLAFAGWCGLHLTTSQTMRSLGLAGTTALLTAFAILAYGYPFAVAEWFAGMQASASLISRLVDLRILRFFLFTPSHPMLGLTIIAAVAAGSWWCWQHRTRIVSPWVTLTALALLAAVIFRFSLVVAFRVYDLYPLFSLMVAGLAVTVARAKTTWIRIALLAALALPGVGTVRFVLLAFHYHVHGMSLADARGAFEQVLATESGPIGVTSTLWLLTEDYDRLRINFGLENIDDRTGQPLEVVVVQQYHYAGRTTLPGYRVDRSYRRAGIPTFLGLPLANAIPGYQFDVHRRLGVTSADSVSKR